MADQNPARIEAEIMVNMWAHAPASEEKFALTGELIISMIDVLQEARNQDLPKDQINQAITAFSRGAVGLAGRHLQMAMLDLPFSPVAIEWDELRARFESHA